jgi:predicted small lipoprotein YifL
MIRATVLSINGDAIRLGILNAMKTFRCCQIRCAKGFFGAALMVLITCLLAGCSAAGPLYRSDEKVRASILKRTPLGSSSDQVNALIKEQHWTVRSESRDKGFMMRRTGQNEAHSVEVGSSFVACELGTTHFVMFPFETIKFAYWGFDVSGRLIDVWVDEETDAP